MRFCFFFAHHWTDKGESLTWRAVAVVGANRVGAGVGADRATGLALAANTICS